MYVDFKHTSEKDVRPEELVIYKNISQTEYLSQKFTYEGREISTQNVSKIFIAIFLATNENFFGRAELWENIFKTEEESFLLHGSHFKKNQLQELHCDLQPQYFLLKNQVVYC